MPKKNEVALVGESFALQAGGSTLNPELTEEINKDDMKGYESSQETLPIVSIQQKPAVDEQGRQIHEAGGFKIYDQISASNNQRIANIDGEKGLLITIMADQKSKVYWEKVGDEKPKCKSLDNITGLGDPGGPCDLCEFSQFTTERPKCSQQINLLSWDHNLKTPYVLRLGRSALTPYKLFKGTIKREYKDQAPLFAFIVAITTQFQPKPEPHYIPIFSVVGQTPLDLFRKLRDIRSESVTRFDKTIDVEPDDAIPDSAIAPSTDRLIAEHTQPELMAMANDKILKFYGDDVRGMDNFLAEMIGKAIITSGDLSLANKEQLADLIVELWVMEGQTG
jgi:hypothetical protein